MLSKLVSMQTLERSYSTFGAKFCQYPNLDTDECSFYRENLPECWFRTDARPKDLAKVFTDPYKIIQSRQCMAKNENGIPVLISEDSFDQLAGPKFFRKDFKQRCENYQGIHRQKNYYTLSIVCAFLHTYYFKR